MRLTRKLNAAVLLALLLPGPAVVLAQEAQQTSITPRAEAATTNTPSAGESGNRPAELLKGKDPGYTDSARDLRVEGTVILAVNVNEKGKVTAVKLVSPLEPSLDRKALQAVKHWKFAPARKDGKAVASQLNVSVDFRLNR